MGRKFCLIATALAALTACGGQSGVPPLSSGSAAHGLSAASVDLVPATVTQLSVSPTSLTFDNATPLTLTVKVPSKTMVTIASANKAIASVRPQSDFAGTQSVTVTPIAVGATSISFVDKGTAQSISVPIVVNSVVPPSGLLVFAPASPYTVQFSTITDYTVSYTAVSEQNYSGAFKIVGCSGPNCARNANGSGYTCSASTDIDLNLNSVELSGTTSPLRVFAYYFGTFGWPAIDCTFTVRDSFGNTGTYEILSAAKT